MTCKRTLIISFLFLFPNTCLGADIGFTSEVKVALISFILLLLVVALYHGYIISMLKKLCQKSGVEVPRGAEVAPYIEQVSKAIEKNREIRQNEEYLCSILSEVIQGDEEVLIVSDYTGNIVYTNNAAFELLYVESNDETTQKQNDLLFHVPELVPLFDKFDSSDIERFESKEPLVLLRSGKKYTLHILIKRIYTSEEKLLLFVLGDRSTELPFLIPQGSSGEETLLGRESKIIELKEEVNQLLRDVGKDERYVVSSDIENDWGEA